MPHETHRPLGETGEFFTPQDGQTTDEVFFTVEATGVG